MLKVLQTRSQVNKRLAHRLPQVLVPSFSDVLFETGFCFEPENLAVGLFLPIKTITNHAEDPDMKCTVEIDGIDFVLRIIIQHRRLRVDGDVLEDIFFFWNLILF